MAPSSGGSPKAKSTLLDAPQWRARVLLELPGTSRAPTSPRKVGGEYLGECLRDRHTGPSAAGAMRPAASCAHRATPVVYPAANGVRPRVVASISTPCKCLNASLSERGSQSRSSWHPTRRECGQSAQRPPGSCCSEQPNDATHQDALSVARDGSQTRWCSARECRELRGEVRPNGVDASTHGLAVYAESRRRAEWRQLLLNDECPRCGERRR